MTVLRIVAPNKFVGASTDTKPTMATDSRIRVGDTFYEYNTDLLYITYDGTTWVIKPNLSTGSLKTVSVTKALEAAVAYTAGDVLSETDTASAGTAWTFAAIARENGASGYITKVHAISETTAIVPRLVVFFFTATPTCELDDNAANTALLHTDLANYVGKVDLPAMEDIGTGDSEAVATPSTTGSLPLSFTCAAGADDLIAVVATRDAFTQTATDDLVLRVTVEQY